MQLGQLRAILCCPQSQADSCVYIYTYVYIPGIIAILSDTYKTQDLILSVYLRSSAQHFKLHKKATCKPGQNGRTSNLLHDCESIQERDRERITKHKCRLNKADHLGLTKRLNVHGVKAVPKNRDFHIMRILLNKEPTCVTKDRFQDCTDPQTMINCLDFWCSR